MARQLVVPLWSDFDVLLTPTLAQPPLQIGALRPAGGRARDASGSRTPPTGCRSRPVWNVTGQPAISLPLHHSPDGLPIGVQLVGPPAGEELLLSLAAQLEEARPWTERRPELVAA